MLLLLLNSALQLGPRPLHAASVTVDSEPCGLAHRRQSATADKK